MSDDAITQIITEAAESLTPEPEVPASEPIPGDEAPAASDTADTEAGAPAPLEGLEQDKPAEQPKKKRGPIPYDRHEAVLTKARNEFAAKEKAFNDRIAALAKYESEDHQAQLKFLDLLQNDTPRAVQILKQVDPDRFGKLSWAEQQAVAAAVADAAAPPAAPPAAQAADPGPKPQADTLNADGTLGYSAEAAEKLVEWRLAKERADYQKEIKALREEFGKDLGPIKEERQAREAYGQSLSKMGKVLENARATWPEFPAHEADMKAWMAKPGHETTTLEDAYRAVVIPKLQGQAKLTADREAAIRAEERKKLIDDMNKRRTANTLSPGQLPPATGSPDKPQETEEIILEAMRANGIAA